MKWEVLLLVTIWFLLIASIESVAGDPDLFKAVRLILCLLLFLFGFMNLWEESEW